MKTKLVCIFLVTILLLSIFLYPLMLFSTYPKAYEKIVLNEAKNNNLSPSLIFAIIKTESSFNPNAISKAGAVGLMQIMPQTAKWLVGSDENLLDPATNIKIGCFYLATLFKEFLNLPCVLSAYNAGPNKTKIWLEDEKYSYDGITIRKTPYSETNNYISRVQKTQEIYKNLYNLK